jgi:hypothetical protein
MWLAKILVQPRKHILHRIEHIVQLHQIGEGALQGLGPQVQEPRVQEPREQGLQESEPQEQELREREKVKKRER